MANSDNVVRLGLTPKPKDKETLIEVNHLKFRLFDKIVRLDVDL